MKILERYKINDQVVVKLEYNDDIFERWGDNIKYDWTILSHNSLYGIMLVELENKYQEFNKRYIREQKLERICTK